VSLLLQIAVIPGFNIFIVVRVIPRIPKLKAVAVNIEEEPVLPSNVAEDANMREEEEPETASAALAIDDGSASKCV
jgi:hypothetical protein